MTALDTVPPTFVLASPETVPLGFDEANYLGAGDTLQSVSFKIIDQASGRDVSNSMLEGDTQLNGNVAVQVVKGAKAGRRYNLIGTVTISETKKLAHRTVLIADF
jgi:hypothetical protein